MAPSEMQPLACVCILHLISRFECNYVFCRWGVNAGYMAHQLCAATWNGPLENLETNNIQLGAQPWAAVLSTTGIASDAQFSVWAYCKPLSKCVYVGDKNFPSSILLKPLCLLAEKLQLPARGGMLSPVNFHWMKRIFLSLQAKGLTFMSFMSNKGQPDFYYMV